MIHSIKRFIQLETAGGMLLMAATVLALIAANTPLQTIYSALLDLKFTVAIGDFSIAKPLLLWINDGLMAIFFFLVGLELKREALVGELNSPKKVVLPALGAIGGMLVPAMIYASFNWNDPQAIAGWAIPTATDIAFALGILTLLGDRVPASLKIFLVSLAIFDDLGAIIIIALFYTDSLSITALAVSGLGILGLFVINRRGVVNKSAYVFIGIVVWIALLKSGVHATLAGVIVAFFIPMKGKDWDGNDKHPMHEMEEDLHAPVAFLILPIFAFANAGLSFSGLSISDLFTSIPLGIMLGLFAGKQIGVLLFVGLGIILKWGSMPQGVNWRHLYGISVLCGVGFTMSLFIGSLAFEQTGENQILADRLGILVGSLISGVWAFIWLRFFCGPPPKIENKE